MVTPVWFLVAIGVSALMVLATWRSPWRAAALWFGVAVAGQGAALQLIDAGPNLRYQHYPPLATILADQPAMLAVIAAQGALVLVALGLRVRAALATHGIRVPVVRILIGIGLSVASAATVSPDVMRYVTELAFAASVQVVAIGTVILMVLDVPDSAVVAARRKVARVFGDDRLEAEVDATPPRFLDRFAVTAALVAFGLAATLNVVAYDRHPHVPDEVVYLYHARYFASGSLTMPAPPVQEAFDVDLLYYEPARWFSPVPPGWPAVLALGVVAGAPWLVNPVLGGISVLLAHFLFGRLYGRRIARYATLLLALSPWFLFLSMSFMTHLATLTFSLAAAVALVRARETGSVLWGVASGVAVGAASLVRPLDGVIVGSLIAIWALGFGGTRLRFRALTGLAAGTVLVGALTFPYNQYLTGNPLEFPINLYNDAHHGRNSNAYGFGPDRGMGWPIDPNPGHSPVDALINSDLNMFSLNTDLFGWGAGSLLFVALLLTVGGFRRLDGRMVAVMGVVYVAHFFYYFSGGPDFGARYWFLMVVPLVALTALGMKALERYAGPRVGLAVLAMTGIALITFVPWRATDKYRNFRGMRADIRTLVAERGIDGDLVLIRGERHPDYASAVILNPLDLRGDATVFAWDRDPDVRAAVIAAYPDRRVWIVEGPTVTQGDYRVARGPLPASALMSGETRE